MFADPEPLDRQVNDLASLRQLCWLAPQILVAMLTAEDWMNEDFIGRLYLLEMMSAMSLLPTGLLAALFPQALERANKTIRGGRQAAMMTIFGKLSFQRFDTLLLKADQPFEGLDLLMLGFKSADCLFESFS